MKRHSHGLRLSILILIGWVMIYKLLEDILNPRETIIIVISVTILVTVFYLLIDILGD